MAPAAGAASSAAAPGSDLEQMFTEASALHASGADLARAEQLYRAVLAAQPRHVDALHQLGALLTQRYGKKQLDEALRLVSSAVQLQPRAAKYRNSLGVIHQEAGRWAEAADAFERANEKDPMNAATLMNLARALRELGRQQRAAEVYGAVTKLRPDHPTAHYRRGAILRSLRRNEEALAAFRQHLRLVPDHQASRFWIAAITGDTAGMSAAPPDMVAGLFDQYADHFDDHLVNKLQYKTPEALRDQLLAAHTHLAATRAASGVGTSTSNGSSSTSSSSSSSNSTSSSSKPAWRRCVDLGCGTGLMGPLLLPYMARGAAGLEGVDLSAGMVKEAARRGCYGRLEVGELVGYLEAEAAALTTDTMTTTAKVENSEPVSASATSSMVSADTVAGQHVDRSVPYDLLVAADVFVYIGDLAPVLRAAAAAAVAGAVLAFSTEALELEPGGKTNCSSLAAGAAAGKAAEAGRKESNKEAEAGSKEAEEVKEAEKQGGGQAQAQGQGLRLQVTGRYAHTEEYLRRVGGEAGWRLVSISQSIIRYNGGEPIWGHLCVMERV
ncbi:hypothetical protein CHLRE_05g247300v5 [Chlamydomonas reinhardtii]|uniref:Uncharacterized protein n=1 Tax=Chlamydomonas reinhardtii TaxID=3055 RepID=A0A2K3DS32_CHLRE|nr:uncharacterized protein CHLRE_05g247300v5 [Chlamydomonas reinhardtii]PNW83340.1 hypothetical protein CHLRE_05g247300v5 [Chlamydomonas reinhardtii]